VIREISTSWTGGRREGKSTHLRAVVLDGFVFDNLYTKPDLGVRFRPSCNVRVFVSPPFSEVSMRTLLMRTRPELRKSLFKMYTNLLIEL
jgi:hypothetical protein